MGETEPSENPSSEPQHNKPDAAPNQGVPRIHHHFLKGVSSWIWDALGIQEAGDTMMAHALTVEKKGRFLAVASIFCMCFLGIGFGLCKFYDELKGVDAENEVLRTSLSKDEAALNDERVENDKLLHQHGDDQASLMQVREYAAGKISLSPSEVMGFDTQTNYISYTNWTHISSTNWTFAVVTQTNIMELVPNPFALDFFQMQRLQNKFKGIGPLDFHVGFQPDDINGLTVSRQVCQIIDSDGLNFFCGISTNRDVFTNGITILVQSKLNDRAISAFTSLSVELQQRMILDLDPDLPTNNVWIFINRKGL